MSSRVESALHLSNAYLRRDSLSLATMQYDVQYAVWYGMVWHMLEEVPICDNINATLPVEHAVISCRYDVKLFLLVGRNISQHNCIARGIIDLCHGRRHVRIFNTPKLPPSRAPLRCTCMCRPCRLPIALHGGNEGTEFGGGAARSPSQGWVCKVGLTRDA